MTTPADTPTRSIPNVAQQFAELWGQGQRPDVRRFLADAVACGPPEACAVLLVDQRERWRLGERPMIAYYLELCPPLRSEPASLVELVRQEYRLRQENGEKPSVEEYVRCFPDCEDFLRRALVETSAPKAASEDSSPSTGRASVATLATAGAPPVPDALALPTIPGFEVIRELGRGGMGVVYQAYDCKRRGMVALKTMQGMDPRALLRFKQEFRSLADLNHPNLVALYELIGDGQLWFFTMELIEGVSFLDHVQGEPANRSFLPTQADSHSGHVSGGSPSAPLDDEQAARLRHALAQLAAGVHFLHKAGKLHRDIKPGNVLVTRQGRVVLLDFGLAAELDRQQRHLSLHLLGTLAYMSPEQAARKPIAPASDWYAVGVMLYETLTGGLPFDGEGHEILQNKQRFDPPAPSSVLPGTPGDLSVLCMELLRRDADSRPKGEEILQRLAGGAGIVTLPAPRGPQRLEVPLIGRQRHLQVLAEAFEEVRSGRTALVAIHGRSGAGKSALLQRFLEDLNEQGQAVVLAGRCYEQESVPYKALDSVVDALSRYLERLPILEAQALWPRDLASLARVFPVLRRLEAVGGAPRRAMEPSDPHEVRRRALGALRELLARLGDRRPLVLAIDDLQWGDEDSAALLIDLLRPPDSPTLLLILCYRREQTENNPCLQALRRLQDLGGLEQRELPVEPLTPEERQQLALALLDPRDEMAAERAKSIARQSGGYPFFVYELVQFLQVSPPSAAQPPGSGSDISLSEVLWSRILGLPDEARRLLEIVAVASRPLSQADACAAAEVGEGHAAVSCLRAGRLLRSSGPTERGAIETYHDRIRETILLHLDPETMKRHHQRLVVVMEASGVADPEALAVHLVGTGENARAGHYYALAAAQASEALAFDRASKLYRLALELQAPQGEPARRLWRRLGDALANAGRGAEAAHAYLEATADATPAETLELKRRAALQLLRSGHIDDGLTTLRSVLTAVRLSLLPTPRRAFWALVFQRLRLFFRGLRFQPRDEGQIDSADLTRLDVSQSAAIGLSMVDTLQGAYFQTRSLLLALRCGQRDRLVTALAMEAAHTSVEGNFARRRTARYLQVAQELANQLGTPYARAMTALARGIAAALEGAWRNGQRLCDEAELILRDSCTGALWERGTAHRFALWPLMFMGEVEEINRRLPRLLKEARERDDLYEETNLCLAIRTFVRMAADEPQRARTELAQVMERWSQRGFHVQHMNRLFDETQIDLYLGYAESAWRRLESAWPALRQSHLLRVQQIRIVMLHVRARCAVAIAGKGENTATWLARAESDARALRREKLAWADALADLIDSAVVFRRGNAGRSAELLLASSAALTKADMHLHAAVAQRRLAVLLGGSRGSDLTKQAAEFMECQTIRNSERMTSLLAPGWDRA